MAIIGLKVFSALQQLNPQVGSNPDETMNNHALQEFEQQTIDTWEAIGSAIIGAQNVEIFRELKVYDGSNKRSVPTEIHIDHFIPEEQFDEMDDPDYQTPFGRNKIDATDVPEFNTQVDPAELENVRKGFRVIIKDNEIRKNSIVRYQIEALDRNLENDIPDTYDHVSPGATYIINKENGELQLFFENKGAYFIRYGIWNGPRNEESDPRAIPFQETVPI